MAEGGWTVYVDDNFHFMDEEERYFLGAFDSYDAAVAACKKIVDAFLTDAFHNDNPPKTANELYVQFTSGGEDPWIKEPPPWPDAKPFSAWHYARQRCDALRPEDDDCQEN